VPGGEARRISLAILAELLARASYLRDQSSIRDQMLLSGAFNNS
jgi:hypothetical protein